MDDSLKNSTISRSNSRTSSLLGSFKMVDSVIGSGKNRKVLNLELKGIRIIAKQQYKKQDQCQICYVPFSRMNRQHHCRVCANAVCSDCSASSINKERACDVCVYPHRSENQESEMMKSKILEQLKGVAIIYAQSKERMEDEMKKLNEEAVDESETNRFIESSNVKMLELRAKIDLIRENRVQLEKEIEEIEGRQ